MTTAQQLEKLKELGYGMQIRIRGNEWQIYTFKDLNKPETTASTTALLLENAVRQMLEIRGIPNI
jgi:hypothetical protein